MKEITFVLIILFSNSAESKRGYGTADDCNHALAVMKNDIKAVAYCAPANKYERAYLSLR